jgi:hypothetical protein
MGDRTIKVEVVYALLGKQEILAVTLPDGATVRQAIESSGILQKYPEIDLVKNKLGVFAKLIKPDAGRISGWKRTGTPRWSPPGAGRPPATAWSRCANCRAPARRPMQTRRPTSRLAG